MNNQNLSLIYIVSNGRSGSTLLDLLLNGFDNVWTIGEINVLPFELKYNIKECGCGQKILRCNFWSSIKKTVGKILEINGNIDLFRESHTAGKVLRPKELLRIFFGVAFPKNKLFKFCKDNETLFSEIKGKAQSIKKKEIEYLVDASKSPYRLFWLSACCDLNLKTIHIIKDPRAFVYSMTKTDKNFLISFTKTIRMSIRYIVENFLMEKMGKKFSKKNFLFIRYEDLASHPEKTLKQISKWLNLPYQEDIISSFRLKENHGVAGNIMRLQSDGIILDEKWKTELNFLNKIITIVLTYFWARRYGYFK